MSSSVFASHGTPRRQLNLTENARKVLEARYLKKNEAGQIEETPEQLFRRVAATMADVEVQYGATSAERAEWEERFYWLMGSLAFMPNSPTLMNAGREMGMLSACFVLPVRDSITDIFNSIKHTALIQKAGGGTGFAFDELRPTGDFIASSGGTTSGPISFWRAFSEATNAIQQGAFRRGANMGMMYIHHPDILKFLHAKEDLDQFTNYNISVKVTDEWMRQFLADPDSPHLVRNPRNGQVFVLPRDLDIWKYDVSSLTPVNCVVPVDPSSRERYYRSPVPSGEIPAELRGKVYTKRDIWNIIIRNAWRTGEPGVVFIDRINEHHPAAHVGRIEATNPCGEQPLLPYEACNLGSVNLGLFVENACTANARVDWDGLREAVHLSTRFLDNVIDANRYPLPEIDEICKANRKIGLGIMGFADALYKLNVPYNSEQGVEWGEKFMKFVNDEAHNYSEHLARERGPFPNWRGSTWQTKHNRLMRNVCTTTVAPTGTISIIANCSGGIEPMFSLAFIRNVLKGQKQGERPLVEVNETFLAVAKARGFYSEDLIERIAHEGTLAHIDEIPGDVKRVFVCAHDIAPEWHMFMQAAFQRHCDSSISKTINFPNTATEQDVEKIYRLAFELGCKGVTVYRDGCRACQPMALKEKDKAKSSCGTGVPPVSSSGTASPAATAKAAPAPYTGETPVPQAVPQAEPQAVPQAVLQEHVQAPAQTAPSHLPTFPPAHSVPAAQRPLEPMDLPEIVSGLRIRQMTPFGNMHVKITVNPKTDCELEVFAQLGKGGDVANSDLEAICRLISLWLRSGGGLRQVVKQLDGIGSTLQIPTRAGRITSLADGLAASLKKYMRAKERFGLRALLLGEADLGDLDSPGLLSRVPAAGATSPDAGVPVAAAAERLPNGGHGAGGIPGGSNPGNGGNPMGPGNGGAGSPGNGGGSPKHVVNRIAGLADGGVSQQGSTAESEAQRRASGESARVMSAAAVAGVGSAVGVAGPGPIGNDQVDDHHDAVATAVLEAAMFESAALINGHALDADVPAVEYTEASLSTVSYQSNGVSHAAEHMEQVTTHWKLKCPECGGALALQEGCVKCHGCGWAQC